jgi:hypothetical protein
VASGLTAVVGRPDGGVTCRRPEPRGTLDLDE